MKVNYQVTNIRNSDVIELSFKSNNPELAKFLLTELIESYLRYDVDTKVKITAHANKQINIRLSELLINMEAAEKELLKYKKVNKLTDIGNIKTLKTDQIKSVSKRIIDANRELQKKENDLTAIKLAEGNIEELLAIADLRNKKEVDAIRANINATGNNIEALQIIYKDEHPKVKKPRLTGTIAAFDLAVDGPKGYLNHAGKTLKANTMKNGVFIRPLGNVVYLLPPLLDDLQLLPLFRPHILRLLISLLP